MYWYNILIRANPRFIKPYPRGIKVFRLFGCLRLEKCSLLSERLTEIKAGLRHTGYSATELGKRYIKISGVTRGKLKAIEQG